MGGNKGGTRSQTATTMQLDKASANRLTAISMKQQRMAEEQYDLYKEHFLPFEIEAAQANRELLPLITETSKTTLGLQKPITEEFYKQSIEGVDVGERVDQAGAEVVSAAKLGEGMRRREGSRYGIDPGSQTYANVANEAALNTAKNVAGARTVARSQAEAENYSRLGFGLGKGIYQTRVDAGADPYARAASSSTAAASGYTSLANRVLGQTGSAGETEFQTPLGAGASAAGGVLNLAAMGAGAYFGSGGGK